jgi:hypothetical protein
VQILDLGVAVVVVDEDADAAALAAAEIRQRARAGDEGANLGSTPNLRAAVFVCEPGSVGQSPGVHEFCREQFGVEP